MESDSSCSTEPDDPLQSIVAALAFQSVTVM
jgi:hypothetical protein